MSDPAPFILTLALDAAAQAHFDTLRSAHFPPERLVVGAHVTLFHALPDDLDVGQAAQAAAACNTPWSVRVTGVRFLGRGVAFKLESQPLRQMRNALREQWVPRLTPQDLAPWQPHVTIQNKTEPAVARALHAELSAAFTPYDVTATGLAVWIYRNGPWQAVGMFPFSG